MSLGHQLTAHVVRADVHPADGASVAVDVDHDDADVAVEHLRCQSLPGLTGPRLPALGRVDLGKADAHLLAVNENGQRVPVGDPDNVASQLPGMAGVRQVGEAQRDQEGCGACNRAQSGLAALGCWRPYAGSWDRATSRLPLPLSV